MPEELKAIVPCIRSSDYELVMTDELIYYLSRRLGLVPFLADSEALNCGDWFHNRAHAMENVDPDGALADTTCLLSERITEIREESAEMGVGIDATHTIIENEKKYYAQAIAWFDASSKIMVPGFDVTFLDYINDPAYEIVGREIVIAVLLPDFPETPMVIQLDVLRRHKKTGAFVIDDYKTTAYAPSLRVLTCPYEFQTWFYPEIFQAFLDGYPSWCSDSQLKDLIEIERDVINQNRTVNDEPMYAKLKVAMMSHIIVQKPTIKFGMSDRYFDYVSPGKRKKIYAEITKSEIGNWLVSMWEYPSENLGKDAPEIIFGSLTIDDSHIGEGSFPVLSNALIYAHAETGKEPQKVYHGEPSLERHIERVNDWYQGTGDFIDMAEERQVEPPVAISQTMRLNPKERKKLYWMINRIYELAIAHPAPSELLFCASNMTNYNNVSHWADFYATEPEDWLEVVERHKFKVKRREPTEVMQDLKSIIDGTHDDLSCFPPFFSNPKELTNA